MKKSKQKEEILRFYNFRKQLIIYTDIVIRGLIAFLFIGILGSIILIGFFHIKTWLIFPIVFILSIIVSPYLSKIRIGENLFNKYDNILKKYDRYKN